MRFLAFGFLAAILAFCNLGERFKQLSGGNSNSSNSTANAPKNSSTDTSVEKAKLTPTQQAIADSATEIKWDDQGISWRLPNGWKKMDVKKESFNYSSPDNAFLLVNISTMGSDFPSDTSLKAYYDQALQQLKNGKYESARYLEIDGIKGVEFVEAMPEEKDGPRRHQWIAYRDYLGQNQMLNVMLSTKGTNFDKHKDDFTAILYSMKFTK